ncbi:MAG: squalene synthase HpnC [Rhodospirillales bacterium]|jgi:squalene synthase HpnC|nr:squalene synthase HpnC [Rhodospirillales bacterium]MDP6882619.1 squalene synthase HpnC [Rhodospirillales bacterium]
MAARQPLNVETPSGKDVAYENFPVGSWLLAPSLRPHVAVFYQFARAADDIADNPDLDPDEKIARLDGFEDALLSRSGGEAPFAKAIAMRQSLDRTGVAPDHCVHLLAAFKQDAAKSRYGDWDDLMGYCALSAASVGRYLLDLHGGSRDGYGPSDKLCMALQVINHLQDCQDDYRSLDRVYLPLDWMGDAGASVEDLDAPAANEALRAVFDRTLAATEGLLAGARVLPGGLASRRLAMESAAIVKIAERLIGLLGRHDPLAKRIVLNKPDYLWCCIRGALSALV